MEARRPSGSRYSGCLCAGDCRSGTQQKSCVRQRLSAACCVRRCIPTETASRCCSERDEANKEGVDASAVAADHIAAQLGALGQSEWRPCMVKKGTIMQGMMQKLPSKRAAIHGWQSRFMTLKDKELRYYERMVRSLNHGH